MELVKPDDGRVAWLPIHRIDADADSSRKEFDPRHQVCQAIAECMWLLVRDGRRAMLLRFAMPEEMEWPTALAMLEQFDDDRAEISWFMNVARAAAMAAGPCSVGRAVRSSIAGHSSCWVIAGSILVA